MCDGVMTHLFDWVVVLMRDLVATHTCDWVTAQMCDWDMAHVCDWGTAHMFNLAMANMFTSAFIPFKCTHNCRLFARTWERTCVPGLSHTFVPELSCKKKLCIYIDVYIYICIVTHSCWDSVAHVCHDSGCHRAERYTAVQCLSARVSRLASVCHDTQASVCHDTYTSIYVSWHTQ